MARRVQPMDSLDQFPTPPWGTRALIRYVLCGEPKRRRLENMVAWEPCAGWKHMSDVLKDYFRAVYATDVFDYGGLDGVGSFVGDGPDVIDDPAFAVDFTITNPPFKKAEEVARRALKVSRVGVAILARTQWIETEARFKLFEEFPLTYFAPFCGRLAMVEGRWDPRASTATSYAWFVWLKRTVPGEVRPQVVFIPPDAKAKLFSNDDIARFARRGME
jgi:hypothetical protein